VAVENLSNANLMKAMDELQTQAGATGDPSLRDGVLHFGEQAIPRPDFAIVNAVQEKHGTFATLFVAQGDSFVRAATNIFVEGERAIGTELDPQGPVIGQLRSGLGYAGPAQILDAHYDTYYEPIFDNAQAVIGAYLVAEPI